MRFIESMVAALIPLAVAISPTSSLATVNTIGQLDCSAGEVAFFDGAKWVCSSEFSDFSGMLEALQQALDDEETARREGDINLQIQIDSLDQALKEEELTRANEDGLLWGQIHSINDLASLLEGECDEGEAVVGIELVDGSYQIVCSETVLPLPEGCPCFTIDTLNEWASLSQSISWCSVDDPHVRLTAECGENCTLTVGTASAPAECEIVEEPTLNVYISLQSIDEYYQCRNTILSSELYIMCTEP